MFRAIVRKDGQHQQSTHQVCKHACITANSYVSEGLINAHQLETSCNTRAAFTVVKLPLVTGWTFFSFLSSLTAVSVAQLCMVEHLPVCVLCCLVQHRT